MWTQVDGYAEREQSQRGMAVSSDVGDPVSASTEGKVRNSGGKEIEGWVGKKEEGRAEETKI